jgi:hypothetical protein
MNLNNLFDYCEDLKYSNNTYIYFKKERSIYTLNSSFIIAINDNNKILTYSNEYLYLLKSFYTAHLHIYNDFIKYYNFVINNKNNIIFIEDDVLSFIITFFSGTAHGYSAIYYIISEYIKNIEHYKNLKIVIPKTMNNSMIDIINYFCNIGIINKNNIIYLEPDVIYKFKSVLFIPNIHHTFHKLFDDIDNLINKYIIYNTIDYNNSTEIPFNIEKICIVKSDKSINTTTAGSISYNVLLNFMNKYNLTEIQPGVINEINLIKIINSCKLLVTSYGSTFEKNMAYISNKCEKIIVLVYGSEFIDQYKNNPIFNKHKNANIIYTIVDDELSNFNDNLL